MSLNVDKEVAALKRMTVGELRLKFAEVFREPTNARNKHWLIKRIAWRMQANEEGDISERARKRAMEIANDADIRMMPPQEKPSITQQASGPKSVKGQLKGDDRLPGPGTILTREYKGQTLQVRVKQSCNQTPIERNPGPHCLGTHQRSNQSAAHCRQRNR